MGALPAASPGRQRPLAGKPQARLSYVIMLAAALRYV